MTRYQATVVDRQIVPWRIYCVAALVFLCLAGLGGRLFALQVLRHEEWQEKSVDLRFKVQPVRPRRGTIYDAGGRELALDKTAHSLYARPGEVEDLDQASARVAAVTGLDVSALRRRMEAADGFVYLARMLSDEVAKQLEPVCAATPGIGLEAEVNRAYPAQGLAAALVGFTGVDHKGLTGLERALDSPLGGCEGLELTEIDGRGRPIPGRSVVRRDVVDGEDIYLTIDPDIQLACERELQECIEKYKAKRATAIVIRPETGAILAAASMPTFDLNRFSQVSDKLYQPMFSLMAYEPGSTLKPLMIAAALDSGKVTTDTHFQCAARAKLTGERVISCPFAPPGGHGSLRPEEIIRYSCNVGAMQVGLALGNDTAMTYLERFGFLRNTGVEFDERPGSVPGKSVRDPRWSATCAFGQSVLVTPLQLAAAYAALANGGKLMRPHVVAERVVGGKKPRITEPDAVGQVVRPEVAREVVDMMTKVVETDDGTGTAARMQGITVAGKTGTAEKFINGSYSQSRYVVSFVGMVPAEAPQYVILVVVDEPTPGSAYGGMVAAPAFRDIAGSIAATKGLEPTVVRTPTGRTASGRG